MLDALYFIILMEIFPFTISISFPVNYTDVLHQIKGLLYRGVADLIKSMCGWIISSLNSSTPSIKESLITSSNFLRE